MGGMETGWEGWLTCQPRESEREALESFPWKHQEATVSAALNNEHLVSQWHF